MKILVLGGTGFIGSSLVQKLINSGHEVQTVQRCLLKEVVVINNSIKADIFLLSVEDWKNIISGFDVIIHLVSTTVPNTSLLQVEKDLLENVSPIIRLLEACKQMTVKPQIIYASSGGAVYGNVKNIKKISEDEPTFPISPYGVHKLAAEKYFHLYRECFGIESYILRIANPYGYIAQEKKQGVIPIFIRKILRNEPILFFGEGKITRDYVEISDVLNGFEKLINYRGNHHIFNLGTGYGCNLIELLSLLESELKRKAFVEYLPNREIDVQHNVLDCDLAKKELRWEPKIDLVSGIRKITKRMLKELN